MKPAVILTSRYHPGVTSMAKNLSMVTRNVDVLYIEDIFPSITLYKIEKKFFRSAPLTFWSIKKLLPYEDRIILGGWHPLYSKLITALSKHSIKPSVMWCSTLGQMEMTCNMVDYRSLLELLSLNKKGFIKHILLNERLYEEMRFLKNAVYFPHTLYFEPLMEKFKTDIEIKKNFRIDLFTPIRSGKNILSQISAIKMSQHLKDIELHTNFDHKYINRVVREWDMNVTMHEWLKWNDYLELISSMHLSMQATHTESFNYAVAERMVMGVPSLVSFNIYNVCKDKELASYLCVNTIDSPLEITKKMDFLFSNPLLLLELRKKVNKRILTVMQSKNKLAIQLLSELFK